VLGHLFALIPRQRLPQMLWKLLHGVGEGDPDGFSGVAVGEGKQHDVAGPAFHQGGDSGLALPHQQVAFPMPGHGPVLHLGGFVGGEFAHLGTASSLPSCLVRPTGPIPMPATVARHLP